MNIEDDFYNSCKSGDLKVAQHLLQVNPVIKNTLNFSFALKCSCYYGHFKLAEWLLQVNSLPIDYETTFRDFCLTGCLEGAKWLLQVNPYIDISFQKESAFSSSCSLGHLDIAKWLLQVKPNIDISVLNEFAFCYSCINGHLNVAKWLQTLKPYLYVINYNEDGSYKDYYIRSKEEERWQKRKYLIWLASDNSPNKKSILYKIPPDVSRYIISNFL